MSLEKYDAAMKIYRDGHNYYDYDDESGFGFVSLHDLTQSSTIGYTDFPAYATYNAYLGQSPGDFANKVIMDALDKAGQFENATPKQREFAVSVAIKTFISYMSSLEAFYFALSKCDTDKEHALTAWDGGAAFLIGSVEGTEGGGEAGNSTQGGRFLYGLSNMLCDHFDTCYDDGGSEVNDKLVSYLTLGQGIIRDGLCTNLAVVLESVVAICGVTLIQSALYFADESVDEDSLAAGDVATMAVLPIVDQIDSASAVFMKTIMTFPSTADSQEKADTVYASIRTMFKYPTEIDCDLVSNIDELCVTDEPPLVIDPEEPTTISNGLYVATNYVADRSAIAFDVKDIEDDINTDDIEGAQLTYVHGENSKTYDDNGKIEGKRSISSFSTVSAAVMREDATYNLFLYGLADGNKEFLGKPVSTYADSFVSGLLYTDDRQSHLSASDGMVALHIWMEVVHKLHSSYRECKATLVTDGRRLEDEDAALFIDEAAAYWIGDGQDTGSSSRGHLLYALTEFIGEKFEDIPDGSQSYINSRVIDLLNQAKNHIAISKSCSTSPDSHLKLRIIIDELIPLMAVPLLRSLFYYLSIGDTVKIKLYALSVLPLFSACSSSTYSELKNDLIDNDMIEIPKEYIYSKIESLYICLGKSIDSFALS